MSENQIRYIRTVTDFTPEIAIVLGSGLGELANQIENAVTIPYGDIPDMPTSTAPSHKGCFVMGELSGRRVIVMQGRVHLYEGYTAQEVAIPIRLMRELGADKLLLTNAAGGINSGFEVGDLMVISDHISCFVPSPLAGKNDDKIGVRFPDMSEVYSQRLRSITEKAGRKLGRELKSGVYLQLHGPNFETPAEIRMAKTIGADAVGMSTAIEAQAAVHCGFEVAGISLISNLACGISDKPITSEEVEEAGKKAESYFKSIVTEAIKDF